MIKEEGNIKLLTIIEIALRWGISSSKMMFLCSQNRLKGAEKIGCIWRIPDNAEFSCNKKTHGKGEDGMANPIFAILGILETKAKDAVEDAGFSTVQNFLDKKALEKQVVNRLKTYLQSCEAENDRTNEFDYQGLLDAIPNLIDNAKKCKVGTDRELRREQYFASGYSAAKVHSEKANRLLDAILANILETVLNEDKDIVTLKAVEEIEKHSDNNTRIIIDSITDLKKISNEPSISPYESLCQKLRVRLELEKESHPSFRLMNDVHGLDPKLIPEGSLLLPVSSRWAELDGDMKSETEVGEDTDGSWARGSRTLADYIRESRRTGRQKHVTIEGEGGIGKTVALLSLAMDPELFPEDLPVIYVPLHRLNQMKFDPEKGKGRLDWFIESSLKDKCGCTNEEADAFYELCRQNGKGWPQVVLLLDGYNEVLEGLKRQVRTEINEWADQPGVQIITTSRTAWSCGEGFMMIRLRPLDRDTIQGYLERTGAEIPAQGDNLWRVINYPLMLTLYTHISAVRRQYGKGLSTSRNEGSLDMRGVLWRPMNKAGDIIWNYIQKELVRCADDLDVRAEDPVMEDCAVAILHTAPYIAWRMSREDAFSIPNESEDETVDGQLSFTGLIRESISCLREKEGWPDQLKRIIKDRGRLRWRGLGRDTGSDEFLDKAERIERLLLNEISLFRIREEAGNGEGSSVVVELMHQQFRDGLAAVWLCQRIETMEKPAIMDQGSFRSTGDKYALPLCWREKIGHYVLKFAAEIMSEKEASLFWAAGRVYQPADIKYAYTMLSLMSERSVKNGVHENDFRELDFSGMDLRQISMFYYRKEGLAQLQLPHKENQGRLVETAISRDTFESQGHAGEIESVSISSDGRRAVSAGFDGILRVWDLENMVCEKNLGEDEEGILKRIKSVSISSDGKRAVSGDYDGLMQVWDLENMTCEGTPGWHDDGWINSVSISNDGKRAVSGGGDGFLRVWNLESMTCEKKLEGHEGQIYSVSISNDGKRAVSGGDDRILRVWDLENMVCEKALEEHYREINSVSISNDGKRAVSGGDDGILRVWNLESMVCEKALEGDGQIISVSISSDGRRAVSGEINGLIEVWDLESKTREKVLEGNNMLINSVSISSDGKRAVSGGVDRLIEVWNLENMTCEKVLEGQYRTRDEEIASVSISSDGKRAVSGGADGILRVWDLDSITCEKATDEYYGKIASVSISSDGKRAVSGDYDGLMQVWDLENMACKKRLEGHKCPINSVSISGDGKRAVSGGVDGILRVWNLENMVCEKALEEHYGSINSVSISGDGKRAVSGGVDGILRVWNLESMACEKRLEGHEAGIFGGIISVSISNDGKRAVSSDLNQIMRVWDLEDMTCKKKLEEHGDGILGGFRSVSISSNGKRAVSDGDDGSLRVWNLENMTCKKVPEGYGWIASVSISNDGKRAVSGADDGFLRIWNLEDMTCEKEIELISGIDIIGIDFSKATIDSEKTRESLRQNGALV